MSFLIHKQNWLAEGEVHHIIKKKKGGGGESNKTNGHNYVQCLSGNSWTDYNETWHECPL